MKTIMIEALAIMIGFSPFWLPDLIYWLYRLMRSEHRPDSS